MEDYLDLDVVLGTPLSTEPFHFVIWRNPIRPAMAKRLTDEYPADGFVRSKRTAGGDKTYSFLVRKTVERNRRLPSFDSLSPSWQTFIELLIGPAYRNMLGNLVGEPLDDYEVDAGFFVFTAGNEISAHTDHLTKATTSIFYFGHNWLPEWGGELCLYRRLADGSFETFEQLLPQTGNGLLLVPSPMSWHGVCQVATDAPRLTLQIEIWRPTKGDR